VRIEYAPRSDAPTVINLTNHGYFNLGGTGSAGLASHRFRIDAARYVLTDELRVPTGELASVAGTIFDFRRPASMHARLAASPWFDHGLVFSKRANQLARVAVIDDVDNGRRMEIRTTEPSVLLNSGNGFDGSETGSEGLPYQRHAGFAFETQHLDDSPNHPHFPSTALRPGRPFRSITTLRFSIRQ
jgi:aldose 1-epimerase